MNKAVKISPIKHRSNNELYRLIEYLTLYVNIQEALIERITINTMKNEYVLLNSHNKEIYKIEKNNSDLLDVLVTLAPKQIEINYINNFDDKELLKVIVGIFKERVNMYMN